MKAIPFKVDRSRTSSYYFCTPLSGKLVEGLVPSPQPPHCAHLECARTGGSDSGSLRLRVRRSCGSCTSEPVARLQRIGSAMLLSPISIQASGASSCVECESERGQRLATARVLASTAVCTPLQPHLRAGCNARTTTKSSARKRGPGLVAQRRTALRRSTWRLSPSQPRCAPSSCRCSCSVHGVAVHRLFRGSRKCAVRCIGVLDVRDRAGGTRGVHRVRERDRAGGTRGVHRVRE